ncbi:unnamed protein product [Blepharisma stoltei]|uniref:RBR-type E3 ubiquitin transferase n=1 Tax=Blepharisma stoltei TaxID=1481888 RepID=A0AAU9JU40_9CILI|nr:unnamed protein product [Blepharisma stoltei]
MDEQGLNQMEIEMQRTLDSLSKYISSGKNNKEHLRNVLEPFSQLLKYTNLEVNVSVTIRYYACQKCKKLIHVSELGNAIRLPCAESHVFCNNQCLKALIEDMTLRNILDWKELSVCPSCFQKIPENLIFAAYGGREYFNKLLYEERDKKLNFQCLICLENYQVKDGITLECDHRFCNTCLSAHLKANIDERKIDDKNLKCPNDCNMPIDVNIIKYLVDDATFQKYLKFSITGWQPTGEDAKEIYFQCPGAGCENMILLPSNLEEYKCEHCNHESCPKCRDKPHKGNTCEAYAKWKAENDQADIKFNELMNQNNWVNCPWCRQPIERVTGCKFMVCNSVACRGAKYFCFDCKKGLNADHEAHICLRT